MPALRPRRGSRVLETLRATLGEAAFGAAWATGRALLPEEAVAEALAVIDELSR